ncbi:alpha/beta hydrolase [Sphingomonas immobilis]|uniref:Alpha/beta hydrolase n=1 Tax=Sphingomonas immobilis TaxID=3063997 RepID=A0ABT9A334_9SPHN|nr:alpha/beta hydrolase [Sphingomonas sp. CA1-15]MDO7843396.1 alpha/beta hydrolase [Sphingomonas sp. CA1-15]
MKAGPLDPQAAALFAAGAAAGRQPVEALSVADARAGYAAGRDTVQLSRIAVAQVEDITLGGRPARRYRPNAPEPGTILFLHGGGWVIGDLETHDGICRHLAVAARVEVIALDYRLAPEHRFPAAFDDALAAALAIGETAGRFAIAGDSAGAALAMAGAVALRDRGARLPAALALFYPVADIAAEAASYAEVTGVPLTAATMRWFWNHYAPVMADRQHWSASPLRAESLAGLPPVFVTIAGHDPLRDEGLALADRLAREGVTVERRHLPGQAHGYLTLGRVIDEAGLSLTAAGAFLNRQLAAA